MRKTTFPLLLACAVLTGSLSTYAANTPTAPAAKPAGIQAITKISDDRILSFVRPARVLEVSLKPGDEVKANQILGKQDSTEEEAALELDKHKAEISDVISRQAELAVKAKDDQKLKDMIASGAAARTELEEQKLAVVVDQARIDNATDQIEQDRLKVKQGEAVIAKLTLKAPSDITGTWVVANPANPNQTLLKVGEIADGSGSKCIRIVKIDPLWVDVSVPLYDARKLNANDPAQVTFSDGNVLTGRVLQRMQIAEAASGTLVVRVEVPNPNKLEPGETVFVNFTPTVGVAGKP